MPDNSRRLKSALVNIHQDIEFINRLAKSSCLSVIELRVRTLDSIRRQSLEISHALELAGATTGLALHLIWNYQKELAYSVRPSSHMRAVKA